MTQTECFDLRQRYDVLVEALHLLEVRYEKLKFEATLNNALIFTCVCQSRIKTESGNIRSVASAGTDASELLSEVKALSELVERIQFFTCIPKKNITYETCSEVQALSIGISPNYVRKPGVELISAGRYLLSGTEVAVPFEGANSHRVHYRSTTSGWSSNFGPEAIHGGVLEILERNEVLLGWYCGLISKPLDVTWSGMIEKSAVRIVFNRVFGAFPLCTIVASIDYKGFFCISTGSSFNLVEALEKAACGAMQKAVQCSGFGRRPVSCNPGPEQHYEYYSSPENLVALRKYFGEGSAEIDVEIDDNPQSSEHILLDMLSSYGFDPIWVDQTPAALSDLGLCIGRAVVPGLIPLTFGSNDQGRISNLQNLIATSKCMETLVPPSLDFHPFV